MKQITQPSTTYGANHQSVFRKRMAEYIFSLNVILISLGILLANQHLSFRNEYLEKSMLPLVCFIPISLFACITLFLPKSWFSRICEFFLLIGLAGTLLIAWLNKQENHYYYFSGDRRVDSLRLDPSPLTPYVFSIRANKGWGPFFYKYTGEGDLDDEPIVGKEVNGKVMVSYSIYGQPICRDLDDWLDNKPEVKVTN